METFGFLYGHIEYEDPSPAPELRSLKDIADGISSSAGMGVAGAAMSLSLITHTPVVAAMDAGAYNPIMNGSQSTLISYEPNSVNQLTVAYVSTNGDSLNVRSGPGLGYPVIDSLANGDRIVVVRYQGNWAEIQGGRWVSSNWISATEGSSGGQTGGGGNPGGLGTAYVSTNGDPLNVRSGPGLGYPVINALPDGDQIIVIQYQGNWAEIPGGGWVSTSWISATGNTSGGQTGGGGGNPGGLGTAYVSTNGDSLNVRSGPGLGYPVINALPDGDQIAVLQYQGNWAEIQGGGWVSTSWISATGNTSGGQTGGGGGNPGGLGTAYVSTNGDSLNVRSGPGLGYPVINALPDGDQITVLQYQGNWAQIQGGGWVSTSWIIS